MRLPAALRQKFLHRFDELLVEGRSIHRDIKEIPGRHYQSVDDRYHQKPSTYSVEWPRFVGWRTRCVTLLGQVIAADSSHKQALDRLTVIENGKIQLEWGISFLEAIKDDFEHGFLDKLGAMVESEIAADYMGQAEQLLADGQSGKYDHVPAAVLAGAVLEKALRTLCDRQVPPVPTSKQDGTPKTLNPLIDDLKKAAAFNESKAKQLRAWADIRNHAAHGEFDQFKRSDVEPMVKGINTFLADYL